MENGIIAKQRLQVAKEFRFHSWGAAKCELRAGGQYRWPSQEPSTRAKPTEAMVARGSSGMLLNLSD
jgi:hypothetical protein